MKIYKDNSKTIKIVLLYPYDRDNKNKVVEGLLANYLSSTNFESKNDSILSTNLLINYIMNYDVSIKNYGDKNIMKYVFEIPNPKDLPYDMKNTLDYIIKMIYNPQFNDKFNDTLISDYKNDYYTSIDKIDTDIQLHQAYKSNIQLLGTKYIYPVYDHRELVDNASNSDIKNLYIDIMSHKPYVIVQGNIDNVDLNIEENIEPFICNRMDLAKSREFITEDENNNFSQSSVALNYQIDNRDVSDKTDSTILNYILSNENLLHKKLRDELGLTYFSVVENKYENGIIRIIPYTYLDGVDKCVVVTNEVIESLKNNDLMDYYLRRVKISTKYDSLRNLDLENLVLGDIISAKLGFKTIEETIKLIDSKSTDEMTSFVKKLKPYSIYKIKGVK